MLMLSLQIRSETINTRLDSLVLRLVKITTRAGEALDAASLGNSGINTVIKT